MANVTLIDNLKHEILMARKRIYAIAPATPINIIRLENGATLYLKREDLGPIHAYKWRGAYNRMATLSKDELDRGVIAASATYPSICAPATCWCSMTPASSRPVCSGTSQPAAPWRSWSKSRCSRCSWWACSAGCTARGCAGASFR